MTTYTAEQLAHSDEDTIDCAECSIALDPGDPLTYLVGAKEGFRFYHPTCIDVDALRD